MTPLGSAVLGENTEPGEADMNLNQTLCFGRQVLADVVRRLT
jgi:hypothetical protein